MILSPEFNEKFPDFLIVIAASPYRGRYEPRFF